jgi:hypothetical protein
MKVNGEIFFDDHLPGRKKYTLLDISHNMSN